MRRDKARNSLTLALEAAASGIHGVIRLHGVKVALVLLVMSSESVNRDVFVQNLLFVLELGENSTSQKHFFSGGVP